MKRKNRILILPARKPDSDNVNVQIQYIGRCLGLFGLRDKDSSCFRIFIELVKCAKQKQGQSSQELAYKLELSRGTVVHHLNRLIDAGIVKSINNRYFLKEPTLEQVVGSIETTLTELLRDLKEVAARLDEQLDIS